ncbi:histone h4 [Paraphaeosphaeria sporulosa]
MAKPRAGGEVRHVPRHLASGSGTPRFVPGSSSFNPRPGSVYSSRATQLGLGLGKGKGAAGLGTKGLLKRNKRVQRDTIQGITKGDIRRLARRGGIKRISATVYHDVRDVLKDRLRTLLRSITTIVEGDPSNRKTVVVRDVIFTLQRLGNPIYGFDASFDGKHRKG